MTGRVELLIYQRVTTKGNNVWVLIAWIEFHQHGKQPIVYQYHLMVVTCYCGTNLRRKPSTSSVTDRQVGSEAFPILSLWGLPGYQPSSSSQSELGIDDCTPEKKNNTLVGGLEHLDYFSIQLGISSSQLTFTPWFFQKGRVKTTNQHRHIQSPRQYEFSGFHSMDSFCA